MINERHARMSLGESRINYKVFRVRAVIDIRDPCMKDRASGEYRPKRFLIYRRYADFIPVNSFAKGPYGKHEGIPGVIMPETYWRNGNPD
jgi:hypothetical protein